MALGGIEIIPQKPLTSMPQKAASASAVINEGLTGARYEPILYVGTQVVKGINHWFICNQTMTDRNGTVHIVKLAVNEFENKYKLVPHSIEVLF